MTNRLVWKRRIGAALSWLPQSPLRRIVLLYHAVGSGPEAINAALFRSQMQWLAGVARVVPIDAVVALESALDLAVAITFDDGYSSVRSDVLPILAPLGLPATVYLNTGWIGEDDALPSQPKLGHCAGETFLRWADVEALVKAGWTMGSHGVDHLDLTRESSDVRRHQVVRSREEINKRLDVNCVHFAYPWGRSTRQLRRLITQCGYRYAAGGEHGPVRPGFDPLAFPRMNISRDYSLEDFKAIVRGDWDYLGWVQRAKGWAS